MAVLLAASCLSFVPVAPLSMVRRRATQTPVGVSMLIAVGDTLPEVEVEVANGNPQEGLAGELRPIAEVLGDELSILLGMPGAFTPTCNDKHLPGYYKAASAFSALGVTSINCLTINDKCGARSRYCCVSSRYTANQQSIAPRLSCAGGSIVHGNCKWRSA